MIVIKRYANRKLYSLESSEYITLGDVLKHVEKGEPIQVLSNLNGEDLTSHTILSALAEKGKTLSDSDVSQLLINVADYIGGGGVPVVSTTIAPEVATNIGGVNE